MRLIFIGNELIVRTFRYFSVAEWGGAKSAQEVRITPLHPHHLYFFLSCVDPLKYFQFCELKVYESKYFALSTSLFFFQTYLSFPHDKDNVVERHIHFASFLSLRD